MSENQTLNVSGKDINWKSNELIDLDDLKALDTSSYLLIDLRPQEDFLLGHLDGALSLPSNSLLKNDLLNLIKTKKLIVLCSATVHQSLETFLLLQELGANDTRILSINASSKQTGDPFQNYKVESQAAFGDRYAIAQRPVKKPKRIQRTNSVPKEKISTAPATWRVVITANGFAPSR